MLHMMHDCDMSIRYVVSNMTCIWYDDSSYFKIYKIRHVFDTTIILYLKNILYYYSLFKIIPQMKILLINII